MAMDMRKEGITILTTAREVESSGGREKEGGMDGGKREEGRVRMRRRSWREKKIVVEGEGEKLAIGQGELSAVR